MKRIFLSVATLLSLLSGCKEEDNPAVVDTRKNLYVYLLADTSITAVNSWDMQLDSIVIAPKPLISQSGIESYRWSTHTFVLNAFVESFINDLRETAVMRPAGLPFVIMVDNERIYLGAFWGSDSVTVPPVAYIDVTLLSPYRIKFDSTSVKPDKRSDQRIYDALNGWGKLVE